MNGFAWPGQAQVYHTYKNIIDAGGFAYRNFKHWSLPVIHLSSNSPFIHFDVGGYDVMANLFLESLIAVTYLELKAVANFSAKNISS